MARVAMYEIQRRKLLLRTRNRTEQTATNQIADALDRRFKWLKRDLRRHPNLKRAVKKALAHDSALEAGLFKADNEGWDQWISAFSRDLLTAFSPLISETYGVESQFWLTRGKRPTPVDIQNIWDSYQARTNRKIAQIGLDTETDVIATIHDWYNSDDSMPELIQKLGQYFDRSRAETIARTESTYLTSQVSLNMMHQFGVTKWLWDLGDESGEWPCSICLGLAQGNPYNVGDPMPPEDSHPRCRCGVVYANENGEELIYGDLPDEYATEAPGAGFEISKPPEPPAPAGPDIPMPPEFDDDVVGVGGFGPGALDLPTEEPKDVPHTWRPGQ